MSTPCYDTKPADDCPVCGGMYKDGSCEVCGYDGELIRENVGKDAINRYRTGKRKAMERDAKEVPEKVKTTVGPPADFNFGAEFRIEWE